MNKHHASPDSGSQPMPEQRTPVDNRPASAGWAALLSGTNGVRSLALAGGVVLHAINVYIATTILPSVVRDIGGIDYYAWNTTLFVAASILGSALSAGCLAVRGREAPTSPPHWCLPAARCCVRLPHRCRSCWPAAWFRGSAEGFCSPSPTP